jgi:hypothetical protein
LHELIDTAKALAKATAARALRQMDSSKDDHSGEKAASLFLRLWSAIRQSMALAARLAPAPAPAPRQSVPETKSATANPATAKPEPQAKPAAKTEAAAPNAKPGTPSPADVADTLAQLQARHLKTLLASGSHTQPIPPALAANGAPLAASVRV